MPGRFLELKAYVLKRRDEMSPGINGVVTAAELMGEVASKKKGFA